MKHVAVIDSRIGSASFTEMLRGSFTFFVAENNKDFLIRSAEKLPDAVIINADYAGNCLSEFVSGVRNVSSLGSIPIIFSTNSSDSKRQAVLCSCGADDVLVLPLCRELLVRRIGMLIDAYAQTAPDKNKADSFEFDDFIDSVSEKNNNRGAFCVRHDVFINLYRFIIRGMERSSKSAQILMFTLNCSKEHEQDETENKVMQILSEAVQLCLRRGDISSVCSKNQVAILLIGADDDGGHLVANRILSSFYSECDDDSFELNYDIREINIKENLARSSG